MTTGVGVAVFESITHSDGVREVRWVQVDPCIAIDDHMLEQADPAFLERDGERVTFHCSNGDIVYLLSDHDDLLECWRGTRADIGAD